MDLPHNLLLFFLLLLAVGLGFLLGRRDLRKPKPAAAVAKDYYRGLNFLLDERPELSVDKFIEVMAVADDTLDAHLAMASVVRRRGEVDKAIRLHQNLLASPGLGSANKQLVEFELARDYHAAGLLDRAEGLLVDIVGQHGSQLEPAIELLLEIYELQQDWQSAVQLKPPGARNSAETRIRMCHYHCELAERHLREGDLDSAHECLRQAVRLAPDQARPHLLSARLEVHRKRYKRGRRHALRALELEPALLRELLALLATVHENLDGDEAFAGLLARAIESRPDPKVLRAYVDFLIKNGLEYQPEVLLDHIRRQPSLAHVPFLLELSQHADPAVAERIRLTIARVAARDDIYQCVDCGYKSPRHTWHCPTCRMWGSFAPSYETRTGAQSKPLPTPIE